METEDAKFLNWLADRLVSVYRESPNVGFVLATRRIANSLPKDSAMEWLPIETAPKDGNDILLLSEEGVWQGCWVNSGKYSRFIPIMMDEHGCGCCSEPGDPATHWMPLPPPPKD